MNKTKIEWADYRVGSHRIISGPYYLIYAPGHPHAKSKGHIYEHRYIIEKLLGRFLETGEHVHHIDGNGHNNAPHNLRLISSSVHGEQSYKDNPGKSKRGTEAMIRLAKLRKKPRLATTCECGCGALMTSVDGKGRERKFIQGHNQRGRSWRWRRAENQD